MITARRNVRSALIIGTLLPAAVAAQSRPPLPPTVASYVSVNAPVVALTHVRIVDGTGAASTDDHKTIIIRGDRIETIGPVGSTRVPDGAEVLDLNGHTVIPGIVGLHQHTWFGGLRRSAPMSVSAPLLYLAMGVTTAMTAGSQFPYQELNLARSVAAGTVPGPRFEIAGPYLTGGAPRPANPARVVTTPEEARRVVAYWAGEGATWIKFLGEGSREVLGAGIREAHARGIKVTGHLCSVSFTEAASLGIDLLQHGFITNSDYVPDKKPDVCPPENMRVQADVDVSSADVQASIRAIVVRGTAVSSTLGVYETFMPTRARLNPEAMEMLDSATRKEVEATHAALAKSAFTVPDRMLTKMMAWERAFVQAGGLLGAGCDPWGTGYLPGFGDLRNYELLVEAGFTAEMAVRIMTSNGARILGKEQQLGTIVVGKVADLVVIRGDPVRAPADIYKVVTVFKGGVGFDSVKLRAAAKGRVGSS